ncbi:MAG: hypothetical protein CMJ67_05250 [Planctomycetaceae bacterium]|nr:hypothetical protein [Planctomycetaceae bacterium]
MRGDEGRRSIPADDSLIHDQEIVLINQSKTGISSIHPWTDPGSGSQRAFFSRGRIYTACI